jgi:hypothetical protein
MNTENIRRALLTLTLGAYLVPGIAAEYSVKTVRNTMYFDGSLTSASVKPMLDYLRHGGRRLVVTSQGGEVSAAIVIAREIHKSRAEVIVRKFCLSSCANYLFLAAHTKSLEVGSVLGFHGAPLPETLNGTTVDQLPAGLKSIFDMNTEFFAMLGIRTDFLVESHRRTLLGSPSMRYTLIADGGNKEFSQESEFKSAVKDCLAKGIECQFQMTSEGNSVTKAYFPSREVLQRNGVKGILRYPYPSYESELKTIAGSIADNFELTGDFSVIQ